MPSLPALYILQWATIGVYVGLYFLIGLLRGAQKSLYFTIVNIITTIVVIVLISNLSIRLVFNFIEFDALIDRINGYTGNALTDYQPYLENPAIQSTIFIFLDLILRIVGFFVLYPLLKRILSFFIFRPIWSFGIKKAIIRKQNKDLEAEAEDKNKTYKPRKRLKKGPINRFFGGLFGGINGLIVAFIILIPITVTASYVSDIDTTNLKAIEQSENLAVSLPGGVSSSVLDEIIKYLEEVQEMDEKGLGTITRQVTVDGVPFDQYIFDEVFTVQTEIDDEAVDVNFIRELENIFGISAVVINGGYLDENFDYTQIDSDNLEDLELIFDYIGNSDVLGYLIPSAARYGIENILADEIGINLYERTASKEAIDMFINIDWNSEMDRLYALVASVLEFGSVDEIMGYAEDPATLADLTPEEGVALANILRSVGDLELLSLINVGIDYLTTLEEAQNQIAWLDTAQEKEEYLQERLDFILDDPDFFIGEDGEISEIANLIELIFTDEHGDTNLDTIVDSGGDIQVILEQQNEVWISELLDQLTEIELLMGALPIGVDYALYTVGGDQVDQQIADDLEIALEDLDWDAEFENFDNIYQNVIALGLEQILVDNPNYITYIDTVVENNMDNVRDIVNHIFTDSQLVSEALDIVAPMIIENYITDEQLKEIVQSVALDDEDAFDFNIGGEIVTILNIAEYAFEFTSAEELSNLSNLSQEQLLEIAASFGEMDDQTYTQFLASFDQLQILNRIDENVAQSIVENFELEDTVYIPSDFALNDDITALIDMVHDIGVFFADEYVAGMDYQDIDITDLLDVLSTDLLDSNERSDLLFYNMVFYAKKYAEDDALSAYLTVPSNLLDADIESVAWDTEINQLLGAVFDLAEVIGQTDGITLSVNDILLYSNEAYRLPIEIITQFSDETVAQDAFSALDSSQIFRASLTEIINTQGQSLSGSLYGYEIQTPDHLQSNGLINAGILVDLIHGAGVFTEGLNETLGFEKIGEFAFDDLSPYFNAFNQMDAVEIEALVETDLLHGVISEMLLDGNFQSELVTVLNDAQEIATLPQDFLDVDDDLIDDGVLVSGEITSLFIMLQALELTSTEDFSNIGLETFTNLIVKDTNGEDNFDEFFGSDYIYTLLDRMLQFDGLNDYLNDMLSDAIGGDFQTLDLTIPNAMLGQSADVGTSIEAIEEGRIPRAEFRRMLISLDQLGPLDALGIQTFTDMIDPSDANDNFSVFIESDFIYFVLSRLISNQGFADYAEDALSGAFGDDPVTLDMSVPSDAEGATGIELDFISRTELRNLMVSFKLLGFDGETSPDVATIIDMPNNNTYSVIEDDLDIFLNSIYLRDKISQMLLSDVIIDLIGTGQFTSADFNLPSNAYDAQSRLSQDQIHLVFDSLILIGVADFDNLDIGISSVTDLTPAEQSSLLDSLYLYEVIDLMIKAQSTDLSIPVDAYVSGGFYDQMISRTEILAVLSVFAIPEIGSDPTQIDTNSITTAVLKQVLDKESLIITQMVSEQIETALSVDNTIAPDAYETIPGVDRITLNEIKALVEVMEEINMTDLSSSFDVDDIGVTELQNVHYLGLGTDPVSDDYDSYLIHHIVSGQIEDTLTVDALTHPDAYFETPLGIDMITADEVQALIEVMSVIGMNDLASGFDVSNVTVANLQDIHYLGLGTDPVSDDYESYIIHDLIDSQIETALTISIATHPDAYFTTPNSIDMIDADEVQALLEAMTIMGVTDLSGAISVSNVTVSDLQDLHYLGLGTDPVSDDYDSYIIHDLIDTQIETILSVNYAAMPEAYFETAGGIDMLTADEVQALIEAMSEMGVTDLSASFDAEDVNTTQLQNLHYLGLGTDPVSDDYDSYIIHRMLSDGIKGVISDRPSTVYMANDDLLADEVQGIIDAVSILNTNPNASLSTMSFANNGLTPDKIEDLLDIGSLLVHRQISAGIISASLAVNESYAVNGDFNYDANAINKDLKEAEMYALVAAMEEMGLTDLSGSFDPANITVAKLQNLHYIGLATHPTNEEHQSYIVHHLVSDGIVSAISDRPSTVYMGNGDITVSEIQGVIDAIGILNTNPNASLSTMSFANGGLTADKIEDLLDIDALIIDRQIATGIINASLAVSESYAVSGDDNYDPSGINKDIKESEMYALVEAMDIMGLANLGGTFAPDAITINNLQSLHYVGLGTDPVTDTYDSYIVHNMISDSMETTLDVPTDAYMASGYMKANEVQGVVDALLLLSSDPNSDTLTSIMPVATSTFTPSLIEDLLDIGALTIYRLVADGIITSNVATLESEAELGDVNYDAAAVGDDLKLDEMYGLAEAMTILGIADVTQVTNINMGSILGLSDAEVDTILDNSNTITFYIIDDVVDPGNNLFDPDTFLDESGSERVLRATLITYIKNNN